MIWKAGQRVMDLSGAGCVMGILNVTPDSFSDGGCHRSEALALEHARRLVAEGAEILDIGGESTRPGALPVDEDEEIRRTERVVWRLRREWDGWISIDTTKPAVAEAALDAGADVVNDVMGLRRPGMVELCVERGCGVVVMHMQGEPRTMQDAPNYEDVVGEVRGFFEERWEVMREAGMELERVVWDPGIGFGKSVEHNLALLREGCGMGVEGRPVLWGVSRKSLIGKVLGEVSAVERDWATVALTAWGREGGVKLHRVHAVKANVQAMRMVEAIGRFGG